MKRFVVDRLQDWFTSGNRRADAAILYRSNAQSRELEDALLRVGMPYRIYGGHRFYERLEIKNALSYLRLLINRHDDTAVERIINVPTRGIGGRTIDTVRQVAREYNCSLWQACVECVNQTLLVLEQNDAILAFLKLIDDMQQTALDWNYIKKWNTSSSTADSSATMRKKGEKRHAPVLKISKS